MRPHGKRLLKKRLPHCSNLSFLHFFFYKFTCEIILIVKLCVSDGPARTVVGVVGRAGGGPVQLRQPWQQHRIHAGLRTARAGHTGRQSDQAGRFVASHLPEQDQGGAQLRRRLHGGRTQIRGAFLRHRVRRLQQEQRLLRFWKRKSHLQDRNAPQRMRFHSGKDALAVAVPSDPQSRARAFQTH